MTIGLLENRGMDKFTEDKIHEAGRLLKERSLIAEQCMNYYGGAHPMPWVHKKAETQYAKLLQQSLTNFPVLIVDSITDRAFVEGFRVDSDEADEKVWGEIWQPNRLDLFAPVVHMYSAVAGVSYVSVGKPQRPGARVRVRGESPFEVYHEPDPDDPLRVAQALKMWPNKLSKKWRGLWFEEGQMLRLEADWQEGQAEPDRWVVVGRESGAWFGDDLPIVPFLNRPDLGGTGRSELIDLIPIFDRINVLTADLLLAAEVGAFKIRWATGIDIPTDENGTKIEPFKAAVDKLWVNEQPDGKFGQFEETPLSPYIDAIDQCVQQVAAISRTPPFALSGKVTNLSAEALKALEQGEVKKVRQRMKSWGESWEQVVRLGLQVIGESRPGLDSIETIWANPETVSEGALVDSLVKMHQIGMPKRAIWERYGATPPEIERWEEWAAEDALEKMMMNPMIPAPGLAPGQGSTPMPQSNGNGPGAVNPQQIPAQRQGPPA